MARQIKRISDLPEAGPLEGDELLEMVQGGINVRVRADELGGGAVAIDDVAGLPEALDERVLDDDPRLSDSRTPTGGAGGVLSGQYPNPGFAVPMATAEQLNTRVQSIVPGNGINVDDSDPANPVVSAVAFLANTRIDLGQDGAGQTTIVAGTGVTIRTSETLKLRKQWSKASLIRRAADVWDLVGDLEAAT